MRAIGGHVMTVDTSNLWHILWLCGIRSIKSITDFIAVVARLLPTYSYSAHPRFFWTPKVSILLRILFSSIYETHRAYQHYERCSINEEDREHRCHACDDCYATCTSCSNMCSNLPSNEALLHWDGSIDEFEIPTFVSLSLSQIV